MDDLQITFIQSQLYWQNIEANLAMLEEKLWQNIEATDLIILPEMFNTGFTMQAQRLAEPMNSRTFRWMKQQAAQHNAVVTGSYIVREGMAYYNRLIWMEPDGNYAIYDKRHLFRMAQEDKYYNPGKKRLIRKLKGWKICPLVCYDLRFPVWSRNLVPEGEEDLPYHILLYVANWPAARIQAWDVLLQARAIENLSYCIGVNRTGTDGQGIVYNGHSAVVNPKGQYLARLEDEEEIVNVKLSSSELMGFRERFPAHLDSDSFKLQIDD
ncbi:amidohydrolase [Xanthovirga aplysinae]|uniref:amidohydrolase n=1 Tax=Xanthovirga aplysinae TaxID=2529853 RepID=UPI0012BB7648|nr:amidohydrolase [Xanthovirga aplysinae]MTI31644.1 amidohydrolase [Xanthovirga aplysinae]